MRTKSKELMQTIKKFIFDYIDNNGVSPTMQEIADGVGIGKATAFRYVTQMSDDGIINYSGARNITSPMMNSDTIRVPVLGSIACGIPKYAEENIEEYVRLPVSLFGRGNFFFLRACGDSMIDAGIEDDNLVLIREPQNHRIRLHPENAQMDDIFVDNCEIQGIAVKVLKDLD